MIINYLLILLLAVISFAAGLRLDNYYRNKAYKECKRALEDQFIRLQTYRDADDPRRPYISPLNQGDPDGDGPINESFMHDLRTKGFAKTTFRRSDLAK